MELLLFRRTTCAKSFGAAQQALPNQSPDEHQLAIVAAHGQVGDGKPGRPGNVLQRRLEKRWTMHGAASKVDFRALASGDYLTHAGSSFQQRGQSEFRKISQIGELATGNGLHLLDEIAKYAPNRVLGGDIFEQELQPHSQTRRELFRSVASRQHAQRKGLA